MPDRPIRITGSNSSTQSLILEPLIPRFDCGDTILWQINHGSGVDSIVSIIEKSGSDNIWSIPPHRQGNIWTGKISDSPPPCGIYAYSIKWKASAAGPELTYDPIISIRSSKKKHWKKNSEKGSLTPWIVPLYLGLLGIAWYLYQKKKQQIVLSLVLVK